MGARRFRVVPVVSAGHVYAQRGDAVRPRAGLARRAEARFGALVLVDRPLVERVVAPTASSSRCARARGSGEVRVYDRGEGDRALAARRRALGRGAEHAARAPAGTQGRRRTTCGAGSLLIVTVTLNAAIDRTLTVPNFQRGQRHRASGGLTIAGGKGINIARALKRLDVPVVATGLAGGRTGTRIVEELTAEAILNDFVRIADESRTSTAVVDPTATSYTEINEWGPQVEPEELEMLLEKLRYLTHRSRDRRLRRLAAARRRRRVLRRDDPRPEPPRREDRPRLGRRAAPARHERRAVPRLAEPARGREPRRPGVPRGAGLHRRARLDRRARRAERAHHPGVRLLRAVPRGSRSRYRCTSPADRADLDRRLGRRLLAAFLAARTPRSRWTRRCARPWGRAASTLEVGAGRFDPREAGRLAGGVEVTELEPERSRLDGASGRG